MTTTTPTPTPDICGICGGEQDRPGYCLACADAFPYAEGEYPSAERVAADERERQAERNLARWDALGIQFDN